MRSLIIVIAGFCAVAWGVARAESIPWAYWMAEVAYPLPWGRWGVEPRYLFVPRICIMLGLTACITGAAAFASWRWGKWRGPITVWDDDE